MIPFARLHDRPAPQGQYAGRGGQVGAPLALLLQGLSILPSSSASATGTEQIVLLVVSSRPSRGGRPLPFSLLSLPLLLPFDLLQFGERRELALLFASIFRPPPSGGGIGLGGAVGGGGRGRGGPLSPGERILLHDLMYGPTVELRSGFLNRTNRRSRDDSSLAPFRVSSVSTGGGSALFYATELVFLKSTDPADEDASDVSPGWISLSLSLVNRRSKCEG
mmetsp:Transcript_41099/g.124144  ORF Transcript_41099/g.124144 Transcript_41099/m.124144 type:complete len:221 (-) Transcript_41099:17-679(-)